MNVTSVCLSIQSMLSTCTKKVSCYYIVDLNEPSLCAVIYPTTFCVLVWYRFVLQMTQYMLDLLPRTPKRQDGYFMVSWIELVKIHIFIYYNNYNTVCRHGYIVCLFVCFLLCRWQSLDLLLTTYQITNVIIFVCIYMLRLYIMCLWMIIILLCITWYAIIIIILHAFMLFVYLLYDHNYKKKKKRYSINLVIKLYPVIIIHPARCVYMHGYITCNSYWVWSPLWSILQSITIRSYA